MQAQSAAAGRTAVQRYGSHGRLGRGGLTLHPVVPRSDTETLIERERSLLPQDTVPAFDHPLRAVKATGTGDQSQGHLGTSTVFTTWITPFDCTTSEIVTRAALPLSS